MRMSLKNIIIILFFELIFTQGAKAQQLSGAFIVSSVGPIYNMSNNSMAVSFSSDAACLNVQNGTAVLIGGRSSGLFAINCEENLKFNTLGIKLFPNPVSLSAKVQFINTPPLNDEFSISIWSLEGVRLSSNKVIGYELFQGKLMDFSMLSIGTFILQIESPVYKDALKFIKVK